MSARTAIAKRPPKAANPMQSAVHWALLGLVIERPSYGYELAQRFEQTYEGMLELSGFSYIYTALDTLRCRGLVEEIPGMGSERQPKLGYRATTEGVRNYQQRLIAQMREDFRRSRLFARQLAVLAGQPELALDVIESYGRACLEEAGEAQLPDIESACEDRDSGLAERLVSQERRLAMEARLPWIDYARREFKALVADGLQPQ